MAGELVAVASTYFRRAGAVSYNLTDVQSEVLLVDHGLPSPDAVLGGVAFAQIRGVMEAAAEAINQLVEHTPIAIRTDVAVDRYPSCTISCTIDSLRTARLDGCCVWRVQ